MEFLNFLREEPMLAWLVFLVLPVTIVPVVSVLWHWMSGRGRAETPEQPVNEKNKHASETRLN